MKQKLQDLFLLINRIKDTLNAFNDLENKQQCFFICKSIYNLKVYSIHYTLR